MKCSLIISTYNWPEALNLVLKSLLIQSKKPDEIIIADDGSTVETKRLIDSFRKKTSLIIYHVWQEDKGFRKAKILNKAIAKSTGQYIIQIDGDCIMHHHFIRDHISLAKNNCFLFGSRVNIKQEYLDTLFNKKQINFTVFSKGIKKRTRALHIPFLSRFYKEKTKFSKKYRGCNTSYFKNDALKVNGYNEGFEGWGREDSEFALRLINSGVISRRIRYKGIVFHIYHYEKPKNKLEENNHIEHQTITLKKTWCDNGINKYLSENK
ncbi:glycosyltransferase family 2 protein [Mesoflavibacter zeaxanthinifaciens]|uniref:glycosyltransferase family 2 protein n=1 Tax=Mesoflavibacter zeaxanthinifaciens TaxID=393060 RepID=UPI0026EA8C74|nr:glycosyltransferase family 2 protein [Mesoflavibacter zeaxanthinifaciens]